MKTRTTRATSAASGGFTLMEVLVAASIASISFVSIGWSMNMAVQSKAELEHGPLDPALIASEIHELAAALPREPSGVVGVTAGANVAALDSLAGASFSPPIRADGTAIASASGWTQKVCVTTHDLADLKAGTADLSLDASLFSAPVSTDVLNGIERTSPKLYRLGVMVLEDGVEVGTYDWWITP